MFPNLLNNQGKTGAMRRQKSSKFESFQTWIKNGLLSKFIIFFFFAEVCCVIYRIRWENKHLAVNRTKMSLIQFFFPILNGSFFKTVSVYFYNNNFVTVFHAVVSIHFILMVRFDSIRNWYWKVKKKKSLVRNISRQT